MGAMGKVGGPWQSAYHVFPRKGRCGARPSARQRARRQAMARTSELRDGLGLLVARFRRPHLVALWRGSHRGLGLLAYSSREKKEPIALPLVYGLSVLWVLRLPRRPLLTAAALLLLLPYLLPRRRCGCCWRFGGGYDPELTIK